MYKTKVDIVYEGLLSGIEQGKYEPGAHLVISQIAKEYQVSDIPVREAIRRLESEGFVCISANQGAVVYHFTPELIHEIVDIRAVLEGYATRLAIDVLTDKDYDRLRGINQELRESIAASDPDKISQLNVQFHMYIYERLPQHELCTMISGLWEKYRVTKKIFQIVPERSKNSCEEHETILCLMENKEYDKAEKYVRDHKMSVADPIIQQLTGSYTKS